MDLILIQKTIEKLESGQTTDASVQELALLYIVRDGLQRKISLIEHKETKAAEKKAEQHEVKERSMPRYSYASNGPKSEFLKAVSEKEPQDAWKVMDSLMESLKAVNPRIYESYFQKIKTL